MSKFDDFTKLHVAGDPLVLFNAWDAGSAIAVAKSGAKAIATGSASVAMANGFGDDQVGKPHHRTGVGLAPGDLLRRFIGDDANVVRGVGRRRQ